MKSLKIALAFLVFGSFSTFANNGDDKNPTSSSSETTSGIQYRIQLGAYSGEAPEEVQALLDELDGVITMDSKGKVAYLTASFESEAAAAKELPVLRDKGFKSAQNVVVVENYVIPSRTYHFFYDNKKASAAEKEKLFTPEVRVIK
ncbi:MAG: hypothetical protein ABJG68_08680 [Crocinitomicaceae bacterium]